MDSNFPALLALCVCFFPLSSLAQFGPDIDAPTEVIAGTPTEATILPLRLYNYDPEFVSSYTVYLTAATTSGSLNLGPDFLQAQCFLAQNLSVCDPTITIASDHVTFENTTLSFTIPPSVGPNGANYGISIQVFENDGSRYSVECGSNIFNLSSATGNWSQSQLHDYVLSSPDTIPCSSFACVKTCADMVWNPSLTDGTNNTVYRNCAEKCPGVTIPLAQGEAAASSTAQLPSLITYTYGAEDPTTASSSRVTPVCPATTSPEIVLASGTESSSTLASTSTGTVASSTKSSAANQLSGTGHVTWIWGWKTVQIAALLGWAVW